MKKIFIISFLLLFISGCANVKDLNYDNLIDNIINSKTSITNENRKGYLYYLPKGLRIINTIGSNEIFAKDNNYYYLFVDQVSYYNKVEVNYDEKKDLLYSKKISNNDKYGYIEVKKIANEKYFIEIMYNYAKIEVIVPERKIKEAIAYGTSIVTSIKYQDTVLKSLMEEDSLKSNEFLYNIFETADTESGYLQIAEEYGQYEEDTNVDPDFIRR